MGFGWLYQYSCRNRYGNQKYFQYRSSFRTGRVQYFVKTVRIVDVESADVRARSGNELWYFFSLRMKTNVWLYSKNSSNAAKKYQTDVSVCSRLQPRNRGLRRMCVTRKFFLSHASIFKRRWIIFLATSNASSSASYSFLKLRLWDSLQAGHQN